MSVNNYGYNSFISRTITSRIDKCHELCMIGRLAPYPPTMVDSYNNIQFFITPLCDEPRPIVELDGFDALTMNYVGFDHHQYEEILPDAYIIDSYDTDERMRLLDEHLTNQYVIFHPSYIWNSKRNHWYKNLVIDGLVPTSHVSDRYFVAIPTVAMTPFEFETKLIRHEYFELDEFDGDLVDPPEMILCDHFIYKVNPNQHKESVENSKTSSKRWRCIDEKEIVKLDIQTLIDEDCIVKGSEYTSFMDTDTYSYCMLQSESLPLEEIRRRQEVVSDFEQTKIDPREISEDNKRIEEDEIKFLKGLKTLTAIDGLQYCFEDLVNFHVSVKTNPLTILAGMSGTGKSQLALSYAKMLDLSEDNNTLLFMPISPSYQEPSDVLGYYNALNNTYVPSETGFVQFLQHANTNPDQMHMVIFDEMNLSQIEYWFSPFISILEKDQEERILKLYDDHTECKNCDLYPSSIKLTENIIFVGTVNIDDTTKDFSDRLLDRTFVIELQQILFEDFYNIYCDCMQEAQKVDLTPVKCKSVNQFVSWKRGNDRKYMEAFKNHNEELKMFDEMNALIKRYIPYGGISFRVVKNIANYLLNIPTKSNNEYVLSRKDALDFIVKQTILTKVRGTESQLEYLLGIVDEHDTLIHSEFLDLLNQYSDLSTFEKTKQCLKKKAEELRINGYTN